jgi:O-antigen ligase
MLLSLFIEAGVVGIICLLFLALFIVAGIRQMLKNEDDS